MMPIVEEHELRGLLSDGTISGITLDTSVFCRHNFNFKSHPFRALANLQKKLFRFLLPDIILKEIEGHLVKSIEDSLNNARKALDKALHNFDTTEPTIDKLLDLITGGSIPTVAADTRLKTFLKESKCEELKHKPLVDSDSVFDDYFKALPPFSAKKRSEFPDAFALHALEQEATRCKTSFLVVSGDTDWKAFCEGSERLYFVPNLEAALSLINYPLLPLMLRKAVVAWCAEDKNGHNEVGSAISKLIECLDVDVMTHTNSYQVEADAWSEPEIRSIKWPNEEDIDIIEIEKVKEGCFSAVVNLPVLVKIRLCIELSFSFWDSVDKESVSMGGRSIELDHDEETEVTLIINCYSRGGDYEIKLVDTELDIQSLDVYLGEVDNFEKYTI